jgi:adenylyltransferase/sulfurtransferase
MFPTPPPPETIASCSDDGVVGMSPGIIGTMQALECVKLITGKAKEDLLWRRMLIMDGLSMRFRVVKIRERMPDCNVCGDAPEVTDVAQVDYNSWCKKMCDVYASIVLKDGATHVGPEVLKENEQGFKDNTCICLDVRPAH